MHILRHTPKEECEEQEDERQVRVRVGEPLARVWTHGGMPPPRGGSCGRQPTRLCTSAVFRSGGGLISTSRTGSRGRSVPVVVVRRVATMRCASAGVTVHACGVAVAGGGSGGRGLSVAEPVRRSVEAGGGEDGGMGELVYPWDGCWG